MSFFALVGFNCDFAGLSFLGLFHGHYQHIVLYLRRNLLGIHLTGKRKAAGELDRNALLS